VDWFQDIDAAFPLLRGNLIHQAMETTRYPGSEGVLREKQLWTTVDTCYGPQRFESTPDLLVIQRVEGEVAHVKVVDYKSKSDIGHDLTAALPAHVAQVNMYAWLVTRALPAVLDMESVVVDEVEVMYIGSNKPRRFTSAGPLQTRGRMLTRKPRTYEVLTLAKLPLWSMARTQKGVVAHIERMLTPTDTLPPVLPEDEQWRCLSCPVNAVCWSAYRKEQGAA
jgi:CRISPR/Cas system-associated exonuclease Cas4 (RecB family)